MSCLIATPKGHIFIDSGFAETLPLIRPNVAKPGLKFEEVKILLNGHARYDHIGGLAELKRPKGARLLASRDDFVLRQKGGRGDPDFGDRFPFEPA